MSVHRITVRSAQGELAQGTAWAIAPGLVCTAHHVVGHCSERRWLHELVDGATYWLETGGPAGGGAAHALTPAAFDAEADLAVLSCATSAAAAVGEVLPLAELSRKNILFEARGYPGFHDAQQFTISGSVVDLRGTEGARAVQLQLDQGSDVEWGGLSGAPVVDPLRVIGAVTQVTQGTATAWAAPVEALQRLLKLVDLAAQAAPLLQPAPPAAAGAGAPDGAGRLGVDRSRLAEILQRLAREHPDDAGVAALREALTRLEPAQAAPAFSLAVSARLRDDYDVIAVREGGRVIRPVAAREFSEILAGSSRFGGRHQELARLDRHALQTPAGYLFVTGISGFGKTSLLARWIDLLRRRGDKVCFHFFTPRVPDSLQARHAFLRLSEQLLAAHALGGDPPRDDEARLRALYVDLLALPAPGGRPLVVVLDGLDEAHDTLRPSPAMFPKGLGAGVHVVFSARKTAGRDWLADLDLPLDDDACIELGRLGEADIAEIVARAGLAADADTTARLSQKTLGDPFYVADVVRALAKAQGDPAVLEALPATHSDYLREWWKDAVKRIARPGFVDLMGTLAALRAPLGPRELTSISADDQLDNAYIDVLLEDAARYVEDDRQGRYWLRHDRIRRFVRDTLGTDMRKYDERATTFALRWDDAGLSDEARAYGRRHVVAHLLADDRFADALDQLSADFIAARWREDGSYSPMLGDLDTMLEWTASRTHDRSAMCHSLALATMRESARDLMLGLPGPVCRAWLRLDGAARTQDMLASLPSHRGEAREQLLAVAGEMLDLAEPGAAGQPGRAAAGELLARVIGLLPLVRTDDWVREALVEVCRLLTAHPLDARQADGLLRQAMAYAGQLDAQRRDLQAVCLALLATAALPRDRTLAAQLIGQVESLASELPAGDRAVALAAAFPAFRELAPDRIDALARATAEALAQDPSQSAFARAPLDLLLAAWAPDPQAAQALPDRSRAPLSLLSTLGLADAAAQRLDEMLQAGEPDVELLLEGYDALTAQRPRLLAAMATLPVQPEAPLGRAFALAGRWADMRAVLESLDGQTLADVLPDCLAPVLAKADDGERQKTIDFILAQLERVEPGDAAETAGRIAHALARSGHASARRALGLAFRLALSQLPEGDADDTRRLVAVALTGDGRLEQALDVALGCQWWHQRIAALAAVVGGLPADSPDRAGVAARITGLLQQMEDEGTFADDAARAACAAVRALAPAQRDAALQLLAAASQVASQAATGWRGFGAALEVQHTRMALHADDDSGQAMALLASVRHRAYGEEDGAGYKMLFSLCGALIENGAAQEELVVHELEAARGRGLKGHDLVTVLASAAAAMAVANVDRAAQWLREGLDALPGLGDADNDIDADADPSADVGYFRRLLADLTGGDMNAPPWTGTLAALLEAMVAAALRFDPQGLSDLLLAAWQRTFELPKDVRTRRFAVKNYLNRLVAMPAEREATCRAIVERVRADLAPQHAEIDLDSLLLEAAGGFAARGRLDCARAAAQGIAEDGPREESANQIEHCDGFFALADRTPAEQMLFDVCEITHLGALTVALLRDDGNIDELLTAILDQLGEARVRRLLFPTLAPMLAAVLMRRWGSEAGKDAVEAVAGVDRRLIDAAARVVRTEAGPRT